MLPKRLPSTLLFYFALGHEFSNRARCMLRSRRPPDFRIGCVFVCARFVLWSIWLCVVDTSVNSVTRVAEYPATIVFDSLAAPQRMQSNECETLKTVKINTAARFFFLLHFLKMKASNVSSALTASGASRKNDADINGYRSWSASYSPVERVAWNSVWNRKMFQFKTTQ